MFQPSQTIAWTVGTLGFSLIAIMIGLGLGGDGLQVSWGLEAAFGAEGGHTEKLRKGPWFTYQKA